MDWEEKLNNLHTWYETAMIKPEDHLSIPEYFNLSSMKGNVLDVGAGPHKGMWIKKHINCEYVGIDPVPADETIIKACGETIPFEDGTFDNVITISTIQHCYSPTVFISECERVLKSDGLFMGTIYCSETNNMILNSFDVEKATKQLSIKFNIINSQFYNDVFYFKARK